MKLNKIVTATVLALASAGASAAVKSPWDLYTMDQIMKDPGLIFFWQHQKDDHKSTEKELQQISTCKYVEDSEGRAKCSQDPKTAELVNIIKYYGDTDPNGKRTQKRVSIITQPDSDKGVATLLHSFAEYEKDQEMWLFLPDVGKIRRMITSDQGDEPNPSSIFGSEFNTEDVDTKPLNDYKFKILEDTVYNGRDCWVMELVPVESRLKKSLYSKSVFTIDKKSLNSYKRVNYNRQGQVFKIFTFEYTGNDESGWALKNTIVKNVLDKRMSRLTQLQKTANFPVEDEFVSERALTDKLFQQRSLEKML